MATTLQALKFYYDNILRADFAHIPTAHQTLLTNLSVQVDSGVVSLADARSQIIKLAAETTSVASMAYSFFTPGVPGSGGLDYLISSTGPNPTNLNSDYYKTFNVENRFINFAMNLGRAGEGASWFSASYGALSTRDTLIKAYTEIFGVVPSASKVDGLLGDLVPDGRGGTFTRQAYFAAFSGDGLEGQGTKAAIVGWLLSVAVKENNGPYAAANTAFLADLGDDGVAAFRSDLLTAYGPPPPAGTTGATLTVAGDKSVSPTAADTPLKSTANNDVITVTGDVTGGTTIDAGAGRDTITVALGTYGTIKTSDGGDTVTLGHLLSTTPTLNVPAQYANVTLAGDNNVVTLKGSMAQGTKLTATGTGNVLHIDRTGATDVTFYEGEISGFQTVYLHSGGLPKVIGAGTVYAMAGGSLQVDNNQLLVLKDNGAATTLYALADPDRGAKVDLHLQNFKGALTTDAQVGRGFFVPNGGAIGLYVNATGALDNNGKLVLHVDTDSTAGLIYGYSTASVISPNFRGPLPNLTIIGPGSLTAQISGSFTNVDATMAGDLNLTYSVALNLAQTFRLGDGTNKLAIYFAGDLSAGSTASVSKIYLGAGADTISLGFSDYGFATEARLSNLHVKDGLTLSAPPEIIGFQKGVDHIVLDTQVKGLTANVQQYADGKASLQEALVAVSAHVAVNTGAIFSWNGDTYIYSQNATLGVDMGPYSGAGDGLIKLVGVTGLTAVTGAGGYDVHFG